MSQEETNPPIPFSLGNHIKAIHTLQKAIDLTAKKQRNMYHLKISLLRIVRAHDEKFWLEPYKKKSNTLYKIYKVTKSDYEKAGLKFEISQERNPNRISQDFYYSMKHRWERDRKNKIWEQK